MMAWLIVVPLFWGGLAFALGPRHARWLGVAGTALQCWLALDLARHIVSAPVALTLAVGSWEAPLGIALAADGLSGAMLLLTQYVALPILIYAAIYFKDGDAAGAFFWPLAGLLLSGLNALFLSADLFNIYVTLELVGLAAVGLVASGGGAAQLAAALRYLFATLVGSGAYLMGVALIYGTYGTVSNALLVPLIAEAAPPAAAIAGILMLAGLLLKTALFPFHYWLPPAHGGAAAPVSALLSALVVKASFYLILRLWTGPLAPLAAAVDWLSWLPAGLGALAIFWGSWKAIRAARLKMLIAYSTVAQLGYLFLIFPLLASAAALPAAVMQAFAHGLAKAAMFLAAGVFIKATGEDTVAALAGAAERLPVTLFAFGLAGVTLIGLPPSSGFLAKWQIISTALELGHWLLAVIVLAGGLLAAVYVFRILMRGFMAGPNDAATVNAPRLLEWSALLLAAASVLLGLRGIELVRLVGAAT
jgi:formate hydrogenlyase subunit 3/multisubunit Na+/H+ antiporter MnhD subunit